MHIISKLLFFITIFSLHTTALACSCGYQEVDKAYKDSDVIFMGKATAVEVSDSSSFYEVTFEIHNSYKGSEKDAETVFTHRSSAACGYPIRLDNEYIVFAFKGTEKHEEIGFALEGKTMVSLCGHTLPVRDGSLHFERRLKEVTDFLENVKNGS